MDTRDRIVVGAYIPVQQAEKLALYAVYSKTSKSALAEEALSQYCARSLVSEMDILRDLVQRAMVEWEYFLSHYKGTKEDLPTVLQSFVGNMRKKLRSRGLSQMHITEITTRVQNAANKRQTQFPDEGAQSESGESAAGV